MAEPRARTALATVIDGEEAAAALRRRIADEIARHRIAPGLALLVAGDDPAARLYAANKLRRAGDVGIRAALHEIAGVARTEDALALVARLNADPTVNGILVQLPLPHGLDEFAVVEAVAPDKDIDGAHSANLGLLAAGRPRFLPATPLACLMLLREHAGSLAGRRALVIGRSAVVGRPLALLLMAEDCTVTVAHSKTAALAEECRRADLLVSAVGRPEFVKGDWIKPGAVVIDVGTTRLVSANGEARYVGDVAFDEAVKRAGAIAPVPGGVGPLTIACILWNSLLAACRQSAISLGEDPWQMTRSPA